MDSWDIPRIQFESLNETTNFKSKGLEPKEEGKNGGGRSPTTSLPYISIGRC